MEIAKLIAKSVILDINLPIKSSIEDVDNSLKLGNIDDVESGSSMGVVESRFICFLFDK